MKKLLSLFLAAAILFSTLHIAILISAESSEKTAMLPGDSDAISIGDDPVYIQGSADNVNLCVVGNFISSFAETNGATAASKVFTTWRWFKASSSFYANVQPGSYVYCPNIQQKAVTPEIVYAVPDDSILSFKLGLRLDTADWSDFNIQFSLNGEDYSDIPEKDMTFVTSVYTAEDLKYIDGDKTGQYHTVYVRAYDIVVANGGFIKISLPKAETLQANIVANHLNTDGNSLTGSSAFLIPASLSAANADRLKAGDADRIEVDTSGTPLSTGAGKVAYPKTAVTSLALLNDGMCVSQVDTNWRWLKSSSDFYKDVAAKDEWLYSINPQNAYTNGQIIYKVTGGTIVTFKIILRAETADWEEISVKYSEDGDNYTAFPDGKISYSEKEYTADAGTMCVRSYQAYIPAEDGFLSIELPTAADVMDAIVENGLNTARESLVYSSVLVTPAVCLAAGKRLDVGAKDQITVSDDAVFIRGSHSDTGIAVVGSSDIGTDYARVNGGVTATKVISAWRWFRASSPFYTDVIPASTEDSPSWLYALNPAFAGQAPTIEYDVVSDSVVKFKIGIRTDVADWNDVKITFAEDGAEYAELGDAVVFTAESYTAEDVTYFGGEKSGSYHEVIVREYTIEIPADGVLRIELPDGAQARQNIYDNFLNTSPDNLIYSSVFMLPAECYAQEDAPGIFAKTGQNILTISSDTISIIADITYEELSDYIIVKGLECTFYAANGLPITDLSQTIASGATLKALRADGSVYKELRFNRIYTEKLMLKIGDYDSVSWENSPHSYDANGNLVTTSEYLTADSLAYAKISGPMLIKGTGSWIFSPFFSVSIWDRSYPIVYAMGNRAKGKEPPSIAWLVQERAEIQIPISLPSSCEKFFSDFQFLYSADGVTWTNVPAYLLEYESTTRNYRTWGSATMRTYSVHLIESGWVKVVYPQWETLSAELAKINEGTNFIESSAFIVPPRVVRSSKDSSVSVGETKMRITIDDEARKISLMCLIADNLAVEDMLSALSMKYCYCKVFDQSGKELANTAAVTENMRLSFYTRGNIFEADDTYLFDYAVSVTKVEKFYTPVITSKDPSVVIDDANATVSISYPANESVNYQQLLGMIDFDHCTYTLTTVGDIEYTSTSNQVGSDPVYLNLYVKDCPGMEDGTLYDTYEIFGEILKTDRIFKSRDTRKIYIDETEKIIYFANGMTVDEFCAGVITINTTLEFYKQTDGSEERIGDYGTELADGMTVSSTVGSTMLYYDLKPMSTLITPASVKHISTRNARVIPGYDANAIQVLLPVIIAAGAVLLAAIGLTVFLIVKKKRKGSRK